MIGVAILGCGTVGSGVMRLLTENHEGISRAVGREVRLKYVMDVRPLELPEGVMQARDINDILCDQDVRIVVECIGGAGVAYSLTRAALEAGRSVVSSNKELVAVKGDELCPLAVERGGQYLFEAAVGGGVPILRPLRVCLAGNHILSIDGIVNGSTNYLLTRMDEDGVDFPAALAEAQRLGYAEANPAADVEGWDARRKLAILAATALGARFDDDARIPTQGINALTESDLRCAHALGGTIKLIAHAQSGKNGASWSGWVHPCFVRQNSMLYSVRGVFNGIVVRGDCVGDVMMYGRGAGSLPTASAIAGDIIEAAQHIDAPLRPLARQHTPCFCADEAPCEWVLRLEDARRIDIEASLAGAEAQACGDMWAVHTAPMTEKALNDALTNLHARGVRTGVPVRVLSV